jgi:hypothetical protein
MVAASKTGHIAGVITLFLICESILAMHIEAITFSSHGCRSQLTFLLLFFWYSWSVATAAARSDSSDEYGLL